MQLGLRAFFAFAFTMGVCSLIFLLSMVYTHTYKKSTHFTIVVTTTMLADAVAQIASPHVEIYTLMGPGIDPHTYHAHEQDVLQITQASMVIYHGLHLEGKLEHILKNLSDSMAVVNASDGIARNQLRQTNIAHVYDPHVWHDVHCWISIINHLSLQLQKMDPEHAAYYAQRTTAYIHQLHKLDAHITQQINQIPLQQRYLVTAHDAFGYFGARYGMQVIGLQGISTDAEIGIYDMRTIVDLLVTQKINAIFVESTINPRSIQAVQQACKAHGHSISIGEELLSDSLGTPDSATGTYIGMMQHNVQAIVEVLMS